MPGADRAAGPELQRHTGIGRQPAAEPGGQRWPEQSDDVDWQCDGTAPVPTVARLRPAERRRQSANTKNVSIFLFYFSLGNSKAEYLDAFKFVILTKNPPETHKTTST